MGFLGDNHHLNVAATRAREDFHILGGILEEKIGKSQRHTEMYHISPSTGYMFSRSTGLPRLSSSRTKSGMVMRLGLTI